VSATLDANVLLYASDTQSPFCEKAAVLLEELAAGPDLFYVFWPVIMGYLRIATHPSIFQTPLSPSVAAANIDSLIKRPHVRTPGEEDRFWDVYGTAASDTIVRGNLVSDAHLVALMRQHSVETIWTHDRDFKKFQKIRVQDPFTE